MAMMEALKGCLMFLGVYVLLFMAVILTEFAAAMLISILRDIGGSERDGEENERRGVDKNKI